jgi:hypothetical protein
MAGPALRAGPGIGWAAEPVPLPALNARVTDLTNTLDATQRGRLEAQLAAIDRSRARAGRRAAAADYPARDHRAIRHPPRRRLEGRPQGRTTASSSSSPKTTAGCASRSATDWKGADAGRHRQPHRERAHGAGLQAGRFLRRPARRRRSLDQAMGGAVAPVVTAAQPAPVAARSAQ